MTVGKVKSRLDHAQKATALTAEGNRDAQKFRKVATLNYVGLLVGKVQKFQKRKGA